MAAAVAPNRAGVAAAEEAPEAAAEAMPKDSGVEAGAAAAVLAGRGVLTAAANKGALGMLAEADAGVLDGVDGIWKPPGAALEVPAHAQMLKKLSTCLQLLSGPRGACIEINLLFASSVEDKKGLEFLFSSVLYVGSVLSCLQMLPITTV